MKIKSKKGLSLIALLITILVMLILSAIVVLSVKNSVDNANVTDFMSDIQKIQDATTNYYTQNGVYPFSENIALSQAEILEKVGQEKRAILREEMEFNNDYKEDGSNYYYTLDLTKIDVTQTKRGIKSNGNENDIFVVSSATGTVYYLDGLETKDNTYFSITDKAVKLYSVNTPLKEEEEIEIEDMVKVNFEYNFSIDDIVTGNIQEYKNIKYGDVYGELPTPTRASQYQVSYDVNGGSLDTPLTSKNTSAIIKYEFGGWYKDSIFSNKISESSVVNVASEHTIYARWLKAQSGTVELPAVSKEKYTFAGWYDLSDDTLVGSIGQKYEVTKDTSLIAKWDEILMTLTVNPGMEKILGTIDSQKNIQAPQSVYEIVYEAQGGQADRTIDTATRQFESWTLSGGGSINSNTSNPVIYTFSDTNGTLTANYSENANAITLPNATKQGYTFDGWYTDPEEGVFVGGANARYITNSNVKLYAHYTKDEAYKVEHYIENANDDEFTLYSTQQFSAPVSTTVNATGITIDGCYLDTTVTGTITSGTVTSEEELVLKLYYKRNKYTLTLTSVGGKGDVRTPGSYKNGQTVQISANPSEGYEFSYWSTNSSNVSIQESYSATTTFVMPKQSVTITANFTINNYTLTVMPSEEKISGNYNQTISVDVPENPYYNVTINYNNGEENEELISKKEFIEWILEGNGTIDSNQADPVKYTFSVTNDTLTAVYSDNANEINLEVPNKIGTTFTGWNVYQVIGEQLIFLQKIVYEGEELKYIPTSDIELIAEYEENIYTVEVNPGGETYSQAYDTTLEIEAPKSESYVVEFNALDGYFTEEVPEYDEEGNIVSTTTKQVQYKTEESFDKFVDFSLLGGGSIEETTETGIIYRFGTEDAILTANYAGQYESITLPLPNAPEGYTFDGWYLDDSFENKVGDAQQDYIPSESITLYAKWKPNAYTLTINPGETKILGEYMTTTAISIPNERLYTIILDPMGGVLNSSSEEESNNQINIYKTFTSWTIDGPGTISKDNEFGFYEFLFGAGDTTITANYSDAVDPITLPIPTKEGCSLEGWYSDEEFTNKVAGPNEEYLPNSDITLYAKYYDGVAKIGTTVYKTLDEAIAAVPETNEQTTIEILTNIDNQDETFVISDNKNIILKLNQFEITSNVTVFENNGSLIIEGAGSINSDTGKIITNYKNVTLQNLTINLQLNDAYALNNLENATMNLSNLSIYIQDGTAIDNKGVCNVENTSISNTSLSNDNLVINNGSGAILNITKTSQIVSNALEENAKPTIQNINGASIYLGEDDASVSQTEPVVSNASYYAIDSQDSYIYFYDGLLEGKTSALNGNITSIADGYKIFTVISEEQQRKYLVPNNTAYLNLTATYGGTVSGAGHKEVNETVTIYATPLEYYSFIGWYDEDDNLVSNSQSYSFQMGESNLTLKAKFYEKTIYLNDIDSANYSITDGQIIVNGGTTYFSIPDEGYIIYISKSNGSAISVKYEGETEYTSVASAAPGSTTTYVVQNKCDLKISGYFSAQITLPNGENTIIVDNLPKYNVNLYIDENTLYETYEASKFQKTSDFVTIPERAGYEFLGWSAYADSETGNMDYLIYSPSGTLDLYAIWKIKTLYIEPTNPAYSLQNSNTYTALGLIDTYIRLRAPENTYSLTANLSYNNTSLEPSVNIYNNTGWLDNIKITTLFSGQNTLTDESISYGQDYYLGLTNFVGSANLKIDDEIVLLEHILDGFEQDGRVCILDGRYNSQAKVYTTSGWANLVNNTFTTVSNLTRGNNYFSFNGTNSLVDLGVVSHSNYSTEFTVEVVFKGNETEQEAIQTIISNSNLGGMTIYISEDGKIKGSAYIGGANRIVEAADVYDNSICKATLTYNGSVLCLYINGKLVNSLNIEGEVGAPQDSTVMALGANKISDSEINNYFNGNIYSAYIYNKALTSNQVSSNYEMSKLHIPGLL